MTEAQYVIWGVAPNSDMETLLVSDSANLFGYNAAVQVCYKLEHEYDDPNGQFDDDGFTARQIAEGNIEWFVACVTASKADVELGADYLGGCAYESAYDFLEELYFADMAAAAINEAREKLAELCAK